MLALAETGRYRSSGAPTRLFGKVKKTGESLDQKSCTKSVTDLEGRKRRKGGNQTKYKIPRRQKAGTWGKG